MRTITGKEAVGLIESAEAVIVMDGNQALCYPTIEEDDYNNETADEHHKVDISYVSTKDYDIEYSFGFWDSNKIEVEGNQIMLLDSISKEVIGIKILNVIDIL